MLFVLVLRALPFLVGLLEAGLFWSQHNYPMTYPWLVGVAALILPCAAYAISWKRLELRDMMEKMAPSFLVLLSFGFGLLLIEEVWSLWVVIIGAGLCSFLALELLFLLCYEPASYPVNALSRLNIAFVPLTIWYAVATSYGLMVFIHANHVWHVALCAVLGVLLFRTTGHPGATDEQNRMWTVLGGVIGAQVGLVGLVLPVTMPVQGLVALLILTSALRVRRYLYAPKPTVRLAWVEGCAAGVCLIASLATAKWI